MDIELLSKNVSKEQIYRVYEAVTENFKKYNQITRKECLLKIQEAYQNKEILKSFITDHEFELLRMVHEEGKVYKSFIYEELINRFILVRDENIFYVKINPDIEDIISSLLESKIERVGYDRYDQVIIGLVNYFGAISYEELFEFLKIYVGEYDEETMFDHISTSPIINYLFLCPEELVICRYDLFEDYGEIMLKRRNFHYQIILPELKELISFGHYGFNIYDVDVQSFFEMILDMFYYRQSSLVYNLMHAAHLNVDFSDLRGHLESIYELNEEQLHLFENVYETLPCASNYGIPLRFIRMQENDIVEDIIEIQENAHLSEEDANLFYDCYLSLLEYINEKYEVCSHIKKIVGVPIEPVDVVKIRQVLINHLEDIEEFISMNKIYFSESEIEMIRSFKWMKFAHYVVVKYEDDYTIFMDGDDFYAVKGVRSNISEMLNGLSLPVFVDAVLIPYKQFIVVDGVVQSYPINLGDGYKKVILDQLKNVVIKKQLIPYN